MAKGVKKIKWNGEGKVHSNLSKPNEYLTIYPDQMVWFTVDQWEEGTITEDKKKDLTWIRQSMNRKTIIRQMTIASSKVYGLSLPKKFCGTYFYYIEASLSGKTDSRKTGLHVRGYSPPLIINSKWSLRSGGTSIKNNKKTNYIAYGHIIHLNLGTEGLNGKKLIIEIFNRQTARKDKLIFTYTEVQVINGEVNLKIQNTYSWISKVNNIQNIEEFYIKGERFGNRQLY